MNTDILLIGRLILEYYGPEIEYIQGNNNIVVDSILRFPQNGNENTTQHSTCITENMSEINVIEEFSEGNFAVNFKIIHQYQSKDPILAAKFKTSEYKNVPSVEEVMGILPL